MRGVLTVAAAQPVCVPYEVAANAAAHAATIRSVAARVVVFPELSLTGYELDAAAIGADDRRLAPIVEACAESGSVALVGAPVRDDDGREYLATLAVDGTGAEIVYRKMWPHPPEPDRFSAGDRPAVLTVDGWRLGLAICRDTGVPRHAADTAGLGIDAYLAGALYLPGEEAKRDGRMRDTAIRYRVWSVLATFAGPTGEFPETSGGSAVWAPDGTLVSQAGPEVGATALATLRPLSASELSPSA